MSHQSKSSGFRGIFDAALHDYEETTNIRLVKHPLAEKIHDCHSVGLIITLFQDQVREFGDITGSDIIDRTIKNIVSVLCMLDATVIVGDTTNLVRSKALSIVFNSIPDARVQSLPPAKAILTGLAILLVVCSRPQFIATYPAHIHLH